MWPLEFYFRPLAVAFCGVLAFSLWGLTPEEPRQQQAVEPLELVAQTEANQTAGAMKTYLNLALPGGAEFSPIVLGETEGRVIVARVYTVGSRREIQVLAGKEGRWEFVGRNGGAITGVVDGNFLKGARRGPDGRLWALAGYTPPSNPQRGFRDYLYRFEDGNWKLMGPEDGQPAGTISDGGLHFLGTQPVHLFCEDQYFLLGLEGEKWIPLAAQNLIRGGFCDVCWRKDDAWLFRLRADGGQSILEAYWLKGPREQDITGPLRLETWAGRVFCWNLAVSADGTIAMFGTVGDLNNHKDQFGRVYRQRGDGAFDASDLPFPPTPANIPHCVNWSPRRVLFAVTRTDSRSFVVHRYENDHWVASGDVSQPRFFVHDLKLFFRDDGEPIVVWEDFLPHR
jgi:hypothetical protein